MEKISFDKWALNVAEQIKERATCKKAKVGAVLINDEKAIISTGYNGAPKKGKECLEVGCLIVDNHCVRTTHAEINAITQAASQGSPTRNSTMYTTITPCFTCIKTMINAGVKRVVFRNDYDNKLIQEVEEYMNSLNIEIVKL